MEKKLIISKNNQNNLSYLYNLLESDIQDRCYKTTHCCCCKYYHNNKCLLVVLKDCVKLLGELVGDS